MTFCLPQLETQKFIEAMKNGIISPSRLVEMTSAERRALFSEVVGEQFAEQVNALAESKLILKDQQRGLVTWAKSVTGIKEKTRNDLISKINRMEKVLDAESQEVFLEDLAKQKLGFAVTFEEAQIITDSVAAIQNARAKIQPGVTPKNDPARLEYGLRSHALDEYMKVLKKEDLTVKEWMASPDRWLDDVAGTMKSFVASLDNSFFGRQGLKVLMTKPGIWTKAFTKSWMDIGRELMGGDAMAPIKADIFSRDNALNGKYQAGKFDLGIDFEEAYPSALPRKIPGFGRLYKASESAFSGAALRMRADFADFLIEKAESQGINMLDKANAVPIGHLVNSLTGRGSLGRLEPISHQLNIMLFSAKFLKSNIDAVLAPTKYAMMKGGQAVGKTYTQGEIFARRTAAMNTIKMALGIYAILQIADALHPGSVNWDPRSTDFGKIKIGNTRFDVTGGMGSLVVLGSRIVPTKHEGEWAMWSQTSKGDFRSTTRLVRNDKGELVFKKPSQYGARNTQDVVVDFFLGKASPMASVPLTIWKGEQFGGEDVTAKSLVRRGLSPITLNTYLQLQQPEAAPELIGLLSDILGVSVSTY